MIRIGVILRAQLFGGGPHLGMVDEVVVLLRFGQRPLLSLLQILEDELGATAHLARQKQLLAFLKVASVWCTEGLAFGK